MYRLRRGKPYHCLVCGSLLKFLCEIEDGSKLFTCPNCNSLAKIRGGTIVMESKVTYVKKEYTSLNGRKYKAIERIGDGSIIKRFEATPVPLPLESMEETVGAEVAEKCYKSQIVCPHFLELKWGYGCHFACSYCYLQGTFRYPQFRKQENGCHIAPKMKSKAKILLHLDAFWKASPREEILNSGELGDSLMLNGALIDLIKEFRENYLTSKKAKSRNHRILLLTKDTRIEKLLKYDLQELVVASFSLNSRRVAMRWEGRAPLPEERLKAAEELSDAGYEVRLRIDPMVPVAEWRSDYEALLTKIFRNMEPERITLGSLRGLQSTINAARDKSWADYLTEPTKWGRRVDFAARRDLYTHAISLLDDYGYSRVALCKEEVGMWESLGLDWRGCTCNCLI